MNEASKMVVDELLAECEAKAHEAKAIAEKATDGPWLRYGRWFRSEGESKIAEFTDHTMRLEENMAFVAHARTSNADLADRVLALVKMVRERDEKIAELGANVREALVEHLHTIERQKAEIAMLRSGLGQPPLKPSKDHF